jgi:hypothetical protein
MGAGVCGDDSQGERQSGAVADDRVDAAGIGLGACAVDAQCQQLSCGVVVQDVQLEGTAAVLGDEWGY